MSILTKEQVDIKTAAREFAEGEFPDVAAECDVEEKFPRALWEKACELGFVGIFLDKDDDGAGTGLLDYALILEEFWRVDPGCGNILLSTFGSEMIQEYGSEKQKALYLPPLIEGKTIMGAPANEGQGIYYYSNDGNEYVVNGSSGFVINGGIADHIVIFGKDRDDVSGNEAKYTAFIIEKDRKGFLTQTLSDKLGIRATNIAEVVLENVLVPAENVIGKAGEAFLYMSRFLDRLNIYSSAQAIGASQGCLEKSISYSRKRVQFGRPIGWFQMIQTKIADIAIMTEAARNLYYKAALEYGSGVKNNKTGLIASALARQVAIDATSDTLQIHGGYGYTKELDVERFYRDVQFLELLGTSKGNTKLTLASQLLGRL